MSDRKVVSGITLVRTNIVKRMPAKPAWVSNLPHIIAGLQTLPRPYVDRAALEQLLGVGRRRAQQILAPCITERVGSNGLADRDLLIQHLENLARSEESVYEVRRRQKVAGVIEQLRQERIDRPQLLVEASPTVLNQEFADLPAGISLEPGRIGGEFSDPQEGLQKLLALAMAISNDFERFERLTAKDPANRQEEQPVRRALASTPPR